MVRFKRILLKLSGESLMGNKQTGIDEVRLMEYAQQIKEIADMGVQVAIVIRCFAFYCLQILGQHLSADKQTKPQKGNSSIFNKHIHNSLRVKKSDKNSFFIWLLQQP